MIKNLIFASILIFTFTNINGQSPEFEKLKKYIEKNDHDKIIEYCTKKVIKTEKENCIACFNLAADFCIKEKSAYYARQLFAALMETQRLDVAMVFCESTVKLEKKTFTETAYTELGSALLQKNQIEQALSCTKYSNDKKFINSVAEKFADKTSSFFDLQIAISLYEKTNSYKQLPELYFANKQYDKAFTNMSSYSCESKGTELQKNGEIEYAILYFAKYLKSKAKINSYDFLKEKGTLKIISDKKEYKLLYEQLKKNMFDSHKTAFKEFPATPQSIVAHTMLNFGESITYTEEFLKNINLEEHIRKIIIIESLINKEEFELLNKYIDAEKSGIKKISYYVFASELLDENKTNHTTFKASISKIIGKDLSNFTKDYISTAANIYAIVGITEKEDKYIDNWNKLNVSTYYNKANSIKKNSPGKEKEEKIAKFKGGFIKKYKRHIDIQEPIAKKLNGDFLQKTMLLLNGVEDFDSKRICAPLSLRMYLATSLYNFMPYFDHNFNQLPSELTSIEKKINLLDDIDISNSLYDRIRLHNHTLGKESSPELEEAKEHLQKIFGLIQEFTKSGTVSFKMLQASGEAKDYISMHFIESSLKYQKHEIAKYSTEFEQLKEKVDSTLSQKVLRHKTYLKNNLSSMSNNSGKISAPFLSAKEQYKRGLINKSMTAIQNLVSSCVAVEKYIMKIAYFKEITETGIKTAEGTVTDVEGNVYKTVTIGKQTWMAQNLRVKKYSDNTPIKHVSGNDNWRLQKNLNKGYCQLKSASSGEKDYGILYTWGAATNGNNDSYKTIQGVCPDGWHLPSVEDWWQLVELIVYSHPQSTGTALKATEAIGTNDYGFNALMGGYRNSMTGSIKDIGIQGFWWTSSKSGRSEAIYRNLGIAYTGIGKYTERKKCGMSVRCVED
jgi:uncharacterized protein (TIGR02145 family)